MRYASIGKRITRGIIDFIFIFIMLYIIGGCIILTSNNLVTQSGAASFQVMRIILPTLEFIANDFVYQNNHDSNSFYYLLMLLFYLVEVAYYSILEISPLNGTFGHKDMKICIYNKNEKSLNISNVVIRNCLKTLSRYLFAIPLLMVLFTKNKQIFYDSISDIVVVENH